jgi:hypothetical protein
MLVTKDLSALRVLVGERVANVLLCSHSLLHCQPAGEYVGQSVGRLVAKRSLLLQAPNSVSFVHNICVTLPEPYPTKLLHIASGHRTKHRVLR